MLGALFVLTGTPAPRRAIEMPGVAGGGLPDLAALRGRFAAAATAAPPHIVVNLPSIASYDALLAGSHNIMAPQPGATA